MNSERRPSITPNPNGPYVVNDIASFANQRGPIRTQPTMVLCRCGASANKPYCDGTHVKIGFSSAIPERRADEDRQRDPSAPLRSATSSVGPHAAESGPAIYIVPNGPYVVTGGPELRNMPQGESGSTERFKLCRCGGSKNKPFCDGTHREIGFRDEKN